MLSYRTISTTEEWDQIKEPWNELLSKSITHVPFLRHEFLRQWWDTCGGGEWEKGKLCIITAYDADRLVGIAPFFYKSNRGAKPDLMLIGSFEITDYLDFIVLPEYLDRFVQGLFSFLTTSGIQEWRSVDLYNILDYSPSLAVLGKAAGLVGWKTQSEVLQKAPYISLPGDWETYLCGIDKKQRHEIRRKMRRLAESGHDYRWYVVEDPHSVDSEVEAFLDMMVQDEEKKEFLKPLMREQMKETMHCAFDTGCLHLSFLEIDGKKAAGYFSFNYLNRLWVYNSCLNREFSELSPGWVLLGYLLMQANEDKFDEFDFLRGNETYKYRFGAGDRAVVRMTITR